jgi:acyl-CoA dehydrogenase
MYLEIPKKLQSLVDQAHAVATEVFRPISRKYDLAEHAYPKELDLLAAVLDGMNEGDASKGAGAGQLKQEKKEREPGIRNGSNMATVLGLLELCWGDVGLALTIPRQGLGNAALAAVANEEQLQRFKGKWAAMAITEPNAGSDSAAIRTTAVKDGEHYVLNGEKIFVTSAVKKFWSSQY